jgi:L-aspartate oxidase
MPAVAETSLRTLMASHVGVIRDGDDLADAIRTFAITEAGTASSTLRNMATTALLVATAAWSRRESRGGHYRSDYPIEDIALRRRTMTTLDEARRIAAELSERAPQRPSLSASA